MKKNGFVSTSLIYTFFVVFLLLMLFLLNSYSRIRFLLEDYKYDIKNSFLDMDGADINLIIKVWNNTTNEYETVDEMPLFGYTFESEFSYCRNGSILTYENGNISVTATRRDFCYAYFKEAPKDIILNIYTKETDDAERVLVQTIPNEYYKFTNYSCTDGAELTFNEQTRKFTISSKNKTVCDVEFTREVIINLYKEDRNGTHSYKELYFTKVSNVPNTNYTYDSYECENNAATISFDNTNREVLIESSGKDVCNVYFVNESDRVDIIIMQETETGVDGYTTGLKYTQVYEVPVSGYNFVGYICDDTRANVTYSNGTLSATSPVNTTCRAYFDVKIEPATINYHLQTSDGSYESVVSVPSVGYAYDHYRCNYESTSFTVHGNYVEVTVKKNNEVCDFYFNQTDSDIKVLVYVLDRTTGKYELGDIPVTGYGIVESGCTNSATISYVNSKLEVTSDGPTVCEVYFG